MRDGPDPEREDLSPQKHQTRAEPPELIERALAVGEVTALQDQLSLVRRDVERDVLPFAERHGIGVIAWSPLASAPLTAKFDLASLGEEDFRRLHPFAQLVPQELRRALRRIAGSHGATMAPVAVAWVLSRRGVSGAIVGVRSARESEDSPRAAGLQLSDRELRALEAAAP
jgi:aryl-alcohol dehydrogenase-like predicted oxidoreductase